MVNFGLLKYDSKYDSRTEGKYFLEMIDTEIKDVNEEVNVIFLKHTTSEKITILKRWNRCYRKSAVYWKSLINDILNNVVKEEKTKRLLLKNLKSSMKTWSTIKHWTSVNMKPEELEYSRNKYKKQLRNLYLRKIMRKTVMYIEI